MCGCGRTSIPLPGAQPRGPEVIEEEEWTDGPLLPGRQQATHEEPLSQVPLPRLDDVRYVCLHTVTHLSTFRASASGSLSAREINV